MKLNLFESFEPEAPIIVLGERYSLVKRLSTNGIEQTFLAKDLHAPGHPDCIVSQLHVPEDHPSEPPILRTLFQTEVKALSRLKAHDCIPELLADFEVEGNFYFVREKVEGHSLAEELASPVPWSDRRVVMLLNDLLSTLEFIHQNRIVHSNLMPANLIRRHQDSRLALVGFGSFHQASALVISPTLATSTPPLFNTSPYMPDEQVAGHPHPSSDIYAAGLIAIQALTGQHPEDIPAHPQTRELYWQSLASLSHPALLALLDYLVQPNFRTRCQTATEALEALSALPPEITWFAVDTDDDNQPVAPVLATPIEASVVTMQPDEVTVSQPVALTAKTSETTQETAQSAAIQSAGIQSAGIQSAAIQSAGIQSAETIVDAQRVNARRPVRKPALRRAVLPVGSAILALLGLSALLIWRLPENRLVAGSNSQTERLRQRSSAQETLLSDGEQAETTSSTNPDPQADTSSSDSIESSVVDREASISTERNTSRQAFDGAEAVSSAEVESEDEPAIETEAADTSGAITLREGAALAPEAAKTTVIEFYNFVASRSWDSARSLLSENMAERLEPDFFYQFQDVSVENMRVVNQTPNFADLVVQNTYVYLDGSYQQEERNYKVQMVDNQPMIVDTAFVEVIRDRNY